MKNRTLGGWLGGTLIASLVSYVFISEDLGGFVILANWVFVFIASNRLYSDNLNK